MFPKHPITYLAAASLAQATTLLVPRDSPSASCPTINGETLSVCGDVCYSRYVYTCPDGQHTALRPPARDIFRLYAEDGTSACGSSTSEPMTACHLTWRIGGQTCSRCPANAPSCPPGDVAALSLFDDNGDGAMATAVAGGQRIYLTKDFTVGYAYAHGSRLPDGARLDKFKAFEGGGFFNDLDGQHGWAVCGAGETRALHVKNSTNAEELKDCTGVNLKIVSYGGPGAFQYE